MTPTLNRNTSNHEASELKSALLSAPNLPAASHFTLTHKGEKEQVTTSISITHSCLEIYPAPEQGGIYPLNYLWHFSWFCSVSALQCVGAEQIESTPEFSSQAAAVYHQAKNLCRTVIIIICFHKKPVQKS